MHEVLVNRLGGLSLPRKSVVKLIDRPDMILDVYRGRKNNNTTTKTTYNYYKVTLSDNPSHEPGSMLIHEKVFEMLAKIIGP